MKNASAFLLSSFHKASGTMWLDEQLDRIYNLSLKYDVNIIDYKIEKISFNQNILYSLDSIFCTFIPNGYIIKPDFGSHILIDLRRYKIDIEKIISLNINDSEFWNDVDSIKNKILENYPRIVKSDDEWKYILTLEQYNICRKKGTEKAFTGEYDKCNKKGFYYCVCCDNKLFSSEDKFDSKTGWPSFTNGFKNSINIRVDRSHNMTRQETLCAVCDSHLGHLFADSRSSSGQRYCINSVSLKLK